jgi:predicted dehydrogenase
MDEIKVALIGLDTSHCVEFPRRMQALPPEVCPPEQHVAGMRAMTCLRFPSAFQSEKGQDERQKKLEAWGVTVTTDFDKAVAGCDALMLEINDPALHLEYFTRCAGLGKPIFLDKPLADNIENGRKICALAKERDVRVFSTSALRLTPALREACAKLSAPRFATMYGPLGRAAAGSSIVWYGVHAFEMLEYVMGRAPAPGGARSVQVKGDAAGATALVSYDGARRGVVELSTDAWIYGGCLRDLNVAVPFGVDTGRLYIDLLVQIAGFFRGGPAPVAVEDTLEVMALLDAADKAHQSGREEPVRIEG